jgi:hypothetical protein
MKYFLIAALMTSMVACSTHQHCDDQGNCDDDEIAANSTSAYGLTGSQRESAGMDDAADGSDGDSGN